MLLFLKVCLCLLFDNLRIRTYYYYYYYLSQVTMTVFEPSFSLLAFSAILYDVRASFYFSFTVAWYPIVFLSSFLKLFNARGYELCVEIC